MKTVGIIGGGIGGVAAAVALHRLGIAATVYERSAALREAGAGMMLWPNATRVLKSLGVLNEVVARSGANTNFLVRAKGGEVLMNLPLGKFEVPALCTRRSDVLESLTGALPLERIRLGKELTQFRQDGVKDGGKVRLDFADGSVAEHDAMIGADGIRSRVRAQLFPQAEPVYRGYMVWRGVSAYCGNVIGAGENSETWGRGSRFGILDIGGGKFTWYATANGARREGAVERSWLADRFSGWHEPIPELIETAELILEHGAYDLPALPRWTVGRVTLLGDAAHACTPNLGQGGCMALEDAQVLAKCLAGDFGEGLQQYEGLRRGRTRGVQQRSRWMGTIGQWQSEAMVAGRGLVTSLLPAGLFEWNLRRVYSYEA